MDVYNYTECERCSKSEVWRELARSLLFFYEEFLKSQLGRVAKWNVSAKGYIVDTDSSHYQKRLAVLIIIKGIYQLLY